MQITRIKWAVNKRSNCDLTSKESRVKRYPCTFTKQQRQIFR